ncbi:hypothetical protein CCACVL1_25751 [Corchorus capsularis]|uniref:Uncharacterized protein n=1 Tax=Corchorus capsularis TaxID=210143 RepID=A0A1R3GHD0_COCAP|nr:hypothetical protein CCACVL1_25751 [Corchorus capsularis]
MAFTLAGFEDTDISFGPVEGP